MSKHTPGPWLLRRSQVSTTVSVETKHGLVIAEVGDSSLEDEANARLIAAAPDLLAALKEALVFSTDDDGDVWAESTISKARAAIAKATVNT